MKRAITMAAAGLATLGAVGLASAPAQATDGAPGVVGCSFTALTENADGSGSEVWLTRDTEVTVHSESGDVWPVTVTSGGYDGREGWTDADCILLLA
ncbi:hypothetical protein [Salininema proteolyticum]|uniref:SH3 domain-containing protein n=1 Tax=Salininema proteolyticum TaxID=1607685 RepID=A0ABV8TW52_9ACTN